MEMADGGGGVGGAVSAWCAGSELGGRRLLAVLEAGTLLLVALALLLHALRTRTGRAARRTLRGQHVLITKGDSAVGRELARQFAAEGCAVSVLRAGESAPAPAAAPALDVLVVCGAQGGEGLDALSKAVSEEVYSNFHLLEELGGRMRAGGRLVWVSGAAAGAASGGYAGAARSLQELARSLLEQVAARSGCRAVWCEAGRRGRRSARRRRRRESSVVSRTTRRLRCLPPLTSSGSWATRCGTLSTTPLRGAPSCGRSSVKSIGATSPQRTGKGQPLQASLNNLCLTRQYLD